METESPNIFVNMIPILLQTAAAIQSLHLTTIRLWVTIQLVFDHFSAIFTCCQK